MGFWRKLFGKPPTKPTGQTKTEFKFVVPPSVEADEPINLHFELFGLMLSPDWRSVSETSTRVVYEHPASNTALTASEILADIGFDLTHSAAVELLQAFKAGYIQTAETRQSEIIGGEDDLSEFSWGHQVTLSQAFSDGLFMQSFGFATRRGIIKLTFEGSISGIDDYDLEKERVMSTLKFAESVWGDRERPPEPTAH